MSRRLVAVSFAVATSLGLVGCGAGGVIDEVIRTVGQVGGDGDVPPPAVQMWADELSFAMDVFTRVNVERDKAGVPRVAWDERASAAAYAHAVDMDLRNYFDHDDPEGLGPRERLAAEGITGRGFGENIAMGEREPQGAMEDWMLSEGHRKNILSPSFVALGVGVHLGKRGPWWVQDFLAP